MSVFWFLILAGVVCVNSTFPDLCFVIVVVVSEALLEKWYGCHEESILVPLQKCAELATALIFFNFSLGFFFFLQRMQYPMQMILKLCQELYVELSDFTIESTLYLGCCQVHLQLSQMLHEDTIMSSNLLHQQVLALPVSISCNTLVASFTNVKILKN